jgi:hypothetical protein
LLSAIGMAVEQACNAPFVGIKDAPAWPREPQLETSAFFHHGLTYLGRGQAVLACQAPRPSPRVESAFHPEFSVRPSLIRTSRPHSFAETVDPMTTSTCSSARQALLCRRGNRDLPSELLSAHYPHAC